MTNFIDKAKAKVKSIDTDKLKDKAAKATSKVDLEGANSKLSSLLKSPKKIAITGSVAVLATMVLFFTFGGGNFTKEEFIEVTGGDKFPAWSVIEFSEKGKDGNWMMQRTVIDGMYAKDNDRIIQVTAPDLNGGQEVYANIVESKTVDNYTIDGKTYDFARVATLMPNSFNNEIPNKIALVYSREDDKIYLFTERTATENNLSMKPLLKVSRGQYGIQDSYLNKTVK
ncbi:hypothetical protein [Photobacterium leiognathi]|uniref:hypothetical protein n=1 Tax=Photobacterium leiognathi TaxID=553611 RepID=UPI002981EF11|nr:hypothetical protein [Photobacterium leiognathi]